MKSKQTPIASAVALMLMSAALAAHAQQAAEAKEPSQPAETKAPATKPVQMEAVIVRGIRASLEQSLNKKRSADTVVEVITAEDIGKMPDKNVADSLQRAPGVTISSASASEGGFDENDRVSLRGTAPSLTQTLINGHLIGSGDWFVLNQVGTVGRSVSYSLLPSELVGSVIVRKSSTADLVEGGVAGNVDILTRRPLDFRKAFTAEASLGAVHSDLPNKTDPQFSGLINWKDPGNTVGVLAQLFIEKRHLRRDGQEMLGYSQISPTSSIVTGSGGAAGTPTGPHPDLANVWYPNVIGSALFEQVRERHGGLIDVQIKPTSDLTLDLSGFLSKMKATNYNRNWMIWMSRILGGGGGQAPLAPNSYAVQNGTLTSATWQSTPRPDGTPNQYAIVDQIYRPGANSQTSFVDFDAKYRVNDALTLAGKVGSSTGKGETPKQGVFEGDVFGTGASYTLHGVGSPADVSLPSGNAGNFAGTRLDWIFGASPAKTTDKESYAQLDGEYALEAGPLTGLKFGTRFAEHKRDSIWIAQGPKWSQNPFDPANLPAWNGETYPGNFGSGLGGNFLRNVWQLSPSVLEAWGDQYSNRDPLAREYFPGEFAMKEKNSAVYLMGTLEGSGWAGNVGVRLVRTQESVNVNVAIPQLTPGPTGDCAPQQPCSVPGAITTSAFGSFYRKQVDNTYTDILPSANFKFDVAKDKVIRVAVAKTMARPDYSALGGAVSLDDTNHTGNGGNPNLKPIRSTNFDATFEWYFAPKSLLSAGLFYMDLKNYVSFGTAPATYRDIRTNQDQVYMVSSPTNSSGTVKGFELAYVQPFGGGFGGMANYTYADAKEKGGRDLVGASKNTYNLVGYFENDLFNARLAYTFRSRFFNGLDRSTAQYQDDTATVAASLGYKINEHLTISLDALNLNNPTLKYYGTNRDQPTAFYTNGRQYYLMLRGTL